MTRVELLKEIGEEIYLISCKEEVGLEELTQKVNDGMLLVLADGRDDGVNRQDLLDIVKAYRDLGVSLYDLRTLHKLIEQAFPGKYASVGQLRNGQWLNTPVTLQSA